MIKKGIATVAQQHYAGYASEFWQKEKSGENSLPTPSPQGEHKDHCAKLDWWVDAVAEADWSIIPDWMVTEKFVIISQIILICILLPRLLTVTLKLLKILWII